MRHFALFLWLAMIASCAEEPATAKQTIIEVAEEQVAEPDRTEVELEVPAYNASTKTVATGSTNPGEVVAYAKTLIGTPYLYGSTNPQKGFDCSGFITYVFNHFNISVPRSSIDFTNVHRSIPLDSAKPGDLVLFTGTNRSIREVGHMGIIVNDGQEKSFIHSTSGKAHGVTITPLNEYYMGRFLKVVRVFKQNDQH